uniref:Putative pterin-4-alpha-carbinolamine dehydratase n=1 Tax=Thermogemmatispora argillosa TaxID=2045280 RepID=A0A455T351_9CHLR|nr:pterin-4-alpha-carbinolamine dehydratase [Thermogemmatispora argillosa]
MQDLAQMRCVPCRGGEPALTEAEISSLLTQIPGWQVVEVDGVKRIEKTFRFDNFAHALAFTNAVGALAEEQDHHPQIVTEWGQVKVAFWTHAVGGLHQNDFIMAAKTEAAFAQAEGRKAS